MITFEQLLVKQFGYRGNPKREAFERKARSKIPNLSYIKELITTKCNLQEGFINPLHKSRL